MSTPTNPQQPFYPPGATALPPMPPIPRKKPKTWLWTALAFMLGLIIGGAVFAGAGTGTASPGATVTKTIGGPTTTVAAEPAATETADDPSEDPTTASKYVPHKGDFKVKIKVTSKHCFGEAGCNLEYKVTPVHVGGMSLPDSGEIEVTYKVIGDEDGPITDSFTVDGDHNVEYTKEGYASTSSSSKKLKTAITRVTYDPDA